MQLAGGQRLLQFTLVEKIGRGGMGEVWRALDTTLDREVAIKVLPAAVAHDPERVARLEREAKLLASLSHPNIAAIYGFPEAELAGPMERTSQRIRFLALELVRGEDLAAIVARGPLPVREALDAARQIAAALEAAHDAGVIHRDLKPANVKRTPDGGIKVLDFGLAKVVGPVDSATVSELAQSPTITIGSTAQGIVLGTASYMSPEQARGQAVDRRTDLWAFGCVLYELLSGRKAFDGETVTDVLARVVQSEPDWEALPAATPIAVRRLLRRCLEKNPKKRLRDASDASLLLDENPEDTRSASAAGVGSATDSSLRSPRATWLRSPMARAGLSLALLALVALAFAAGAAWLRARAAARPAEAELTIQRLTFSRGMMRAARFAPDGRTIVYGASWNGPPVKVHLSRTDASESAPLAAPPGELLAVSKSGDVAMSLGHAYYGFMGDGTLARTTLLGGAQRELFEDVRVADWAPAGDELALVRTVVDGDQLEYPAGTVLDKTSGYFGSVRISPDGGRVAYTDHAQWGDNQGGVSVVDREGKKTVLASGYGAVEGLAWSPDGSEVWYTTYTADGGSRIVAANLAGAKRIVYENLDPIELFDVASDGRVLVGRHRHERDVLALLDGFAAPRLLSVPAEVSLARFISRDGRAVLISSHLSTVYTSYAVHSDRSDATLLGEGDGVSISPDGARVLTLSSDFQRLFVTPFGRGSRREVPNPDAIVTDGLPNWRANRDEFVMVGRKAGEPARAWLFDAETGEATAFGPPDPAWTTFTPPPVSSDGRYVVLFDSGGTPGLWPIDGGDPLPIPGLRPDDQIAAFAVGDRELFVAGPSVPVRIERLELATGRRTAWLEISPTDAAGLRYALVTITPDGRHWALATAKMLTDLFLIEGLK